MPLCGVPIRPCPLSQAFTWIEPGPVILVTTRDRERNQIMTISWTMVLDFSPRFALCTGAWNFSFAALRRTRECVLAIPTVDQLDQIVGIGMCSGRDTDKFSRFHLTPLAGTHVQAPLIQECLANIECRVVSFLGKHHIVVLQGVAAHRNSRRPEKRLIHAVGNGTFTVDGRTLDRRTPMAAKLPEGC